MNQLLLIQFELHQKLYNNVLEGFTDVETNQRPCGDSNMNHVKYLAGHLLNSQYGLMMIAGLTPEIKWNELFAVMGQSKARDNFNYPAIEEIREEWNHWHEPTFKGLKQLSDHDLEQPPLPPFNRVAASNGELWAFINHHQAYHIGQISILRKAFEKEPMSYE